MSDQPCALCQKGWPCPWHTPEATADTATHWDEHDPTLSGFDVPDDHNGLQIHHQRHVIPHLRARRLVSHNERLAA